MFRMRYEMVALLHRLFIALLPFSFYLAVVDSLAFPAISASFLFSSPDVTTTLAMIDFSISMRSAFCLPPWPSDRFLLSISRESSRTRCAVFSLGLVQRSQRTARSQPTFAP